MKRTWIRRGSAVVLAMSLLMVGSTTAIAETRQPTKPAGTEGNNAAYWTGSPANIGGTRGWYATTNNTYGFRHTVGCKLNRRGTYNFVVQASTTIWANGARINGTHFKARLVPEGTAGQPQALYTWSGNQTTSFPQGTLASANFAVMLPRQAAMNNWDLEVKIKFPRSLRQAFRYKFRVPFQEIDCYEPPSA